MEDEKLAKVLVAVRDSARYASVADDTVRRIATASLSAARGDVSDAVKRTKREIGRAHV